MMERLLATVDKLTASCIKSVLAAAMALALVGSVSLTGCASSPTLPDTGSAASEEEAARGVLSFTLESPDWVQAEDASIIVKISGTTSDGKNISEQYKAVPDQRYLTPLQAGEYELSLLDGVPAQGDRLYKASAQAVSFDGAKDENVVLVLSLDTEAMAQKKTAEEKAEQEAAAKAAAEADAARKAQEQAAAAEAQRIAEEQAAAEAAAAAAAQQNERTVYVAASGKGKKYHSNPNCSNMKGVNELSISKAEALGYGPCSKCY